MMKKLLKIPNITCALRLAHTWHVLQEFSKEDDSFLCRAHQLYTNPSADIAANSFFNLAKLIQIWIVINLFRLFDTPNEIPFDGKSIGELRNCNENLAQFTARENKCVTWSAVVMSSAWPREVRCRFWADRSWCSCAHKFCSLATPNVNNVWLLKGTPTRENTSLDAHTILSKLPLYSFRKLQFPENK